MPTGIGPSEPQSHMPDTLPAPNGIVPISPYPQTSITPCPIGYYKPKTCYRDPNDSGGGNKQKYTKLGKTISKRNYYNQ